MSSPSAAPLLDSARCYRALRSHDARFDGRFYVGVSTTRVYCRPVCTARTPRPENCRFFPSAAAAESAGFRPCLRCRPELAPGNAVVDASARLAQSAASLIEDGWLDTGDLTALAQQLGVTDRHLRRVFRDELGVSPIAFAQTQRLLLAKRLLTDTAMPVTEVALASGFSSLRRFNALFQARYRLAPSDLRRAVHAGSSDMLEVSLAYRPPFDWNAMLAFLAKRTIAGVEEVADGVYQRTVRIDRGGTVAYGWFAVTAAPHSHAVRVALSSSLSGVIPGTLARVKRMFDLACDPHAVAAGLGPLAAANPGLRLPGAFDGFEASVRAILGQQVTVTAAHTIAGRFANAFGEPVDTPHSALRVAFPSPAQVADLQPSAIAELGVVSVRAKAIIALAQALVQGTLRLDPTAPVEATLDTLRALPGVGEWTAQYLAMRALGWPDAFPHSDYGVLKAMALTNPRAALAQAEQWRPWRSYAVIHLWHRLAMEPGGKGEPSTAPHTSKPPAPSPRAKESRARNRKPVKSTARRTADRG